MPFSRAVHHSAVPQLNNQTHLPQREGLQQVAPTHSTDRLSDTAGDYGHDILLNRSCARPGCTHEISVRIGLCYLLNSNICGQHLWTFLCHTFIQHCREQQQGICSLQNSTEIVLKTQMLKKAASQQSKYLPHVVLLY